MLSGHSFNALLKTLEEPPPHVKFLLATTDPQKLPVTILSRCLQFNLKRLPLELIRDHLNHILTEEAVEADSGALVELARAADGSMRDALSLLDQAIAYGAGKVQLSEVREMLGTIERNRVFQLVQALVSGDAEVLMEQVSQLAEQSPDFAGVLEALNSLFHRLAMAQQVPAAVDDSMGDREALLELAGQLTPEQVQLYYQIGIIGRKDLPLAPDPRSGFEMVLLRILAFQPSQSRAAVPPVGHGQSNPPQPAESGERVAASTQQQAAYQQPVATENVAEQGVSSAPPADSVTEKSDDAPLAEQTALDGADAWATLVAKLPLTGMTRQLAEHTALVRHEGESVELVMDPGFESLYNPKWEQGLQQALQMYYEQPIKLSIRSGESEEGSSATPRQMRQEQQAAQQQQAEAAISDDPALQSILEHFDGQVEPGSVRPPE